MFVDKELEEQNTENFFKKPPRKREVKLSAGDLKKINKRAGGKKSQKFINFEAVYKKVLELKEEMERSYEKFQNDLKGSEPTFKGFILEANTKKIKIDAKNSISRILDPLINQAHNVRKGKDKLSKESLALVLEDYLPIPDEK